MSERIFLILLAPYALLLIWAIRKLKFSDASMMGLGLTTVYVVWGIVYASFVLEVFPADVVNAFDSVEEIMRDVDFPWLQRYLAQGYGWVFGLAFFWACWGVARYLAPREA